MKGVILHGGYGKRLRPLTLIYPKQLLPIVNKPASQYVLEDLRESGIDNIAVVLGNIHPEKVVNYYRDGKKFGVKITYIHQGEPKGIAHAVGLCKNFVGDDPFVVYLGDNIMEEGIRSFVEEFKKSNYDAMMLLYEVDNPSEFGIIELDQDGRIKRLVEKPKHPPSNLAVTGIYFFRPVVFDVIKSLKPSGRGELEITDALQLLIDYGYHVGYRFINGWWKDTGIPEDFLEANKLVLEKYQSIYGKSKKKMMLNDNVLFLGRFMLEGATVYGPSILGRNVFMGKNVKVGPYVSIGNNVYIEKGEIENSIIMKNCYISTNGKIKDSIVGAGSKIVSSENRTQKFVITDYSRVEIT